MKSRTLQDYAERIDRAMRLLVERLEDDQAPGLNELAAAAALSPFHFHRVFRLMTGETVNQAVRRIRLAKASAALEDGSVTEAAGEAAYATSQSFARSMRAFAGMSASEVAKRHDREQLFASPAIRSPLAIELVTVAPLEVIAIRNRGDYADLDEVFGRLFEIAGGPENVEAIYGLYLSDPRFEAAEACLFDGALKLGSAPEELGEAQLTTVGGGQFLRLRHCGDYDLIPLALDELTLSALADERLELRDAAPLVHYLDDPEETDLAALRSDIHLPVALRA